MPKKIELCARVLVHACPSKEQRDKQRENSNHAKKREANKKPLAKQAPARKCYMMEA